MHSDLSNPCKRSSPGNFGRSPDNESGSAQVERAVDGAIRIDDGSLVASVAQHVKGK
jgi:hypothetical protein